MVSIVLTAWNEEKTIGTCVRQILKNVEHIDEDAELIMVCPDEGTIEVAKKIVEKSNFDKFSYIKDPQKGKPHALNLALKKAKGEIIVSTDGDVWIADGALEALLKAFDRSDVYGVTGRPICTNDRTTMWGYFGHLFIDAAHTRRRETLGKGEFYPMSGYLLAVRNIEWQLPKDVLDDVYFSYKLSEDGRKISYAPNARVFVTQPSTMNDWLKQKVRSISGYRGIARIFPKSPTSRTLIEELRYFLFPIGYARTLREFFWSLLAYPFRLYTWSRVWWTMKVEGKKATDIWYQIESTK